MSRNVDPDRSRHDGTLGGDDGPDCRSQAAVYVGHHGDMPLDKRQCSNVAKLLPGLVLNRNAMRPRLDRNAVGPCVAVVLTGHDGAIPQVIALPVLSQRHQRSEPQALKQTRVIIPAHESGIRQVAQRLVVGLAVIRPSDVQTCPRCLVALLPSLLNGRLSSDSLARLTI